MAVQRLFWLFPVVAVVALMGMDRPFYRHFGLLPSQVAANQAQLAGKTVMVSGHVAKTRPGWILLRGRTGQTLEIRPSGPAPAAGTEIMAKIFVNTTHEAPVSRKIHEYTGVAAMRVGLSVIPIPIIAFLFFWEFRFKDGRFSARRRP